jgi:ribonuclease T2
MLRNSLPCHLSSVEQIKMKNKRRRWSTLITLLVMIVIIGISIYQYLERGADGEGAQSQPTIAPTAAARPSPTVAAQADAQPKQVTPSAVTARPSPTVAAQIESRSANFDFYVLTLSWSPDYCTSNGGNDPQQCSLGKKLGFVLHGLWPQYNQGYPSDCSTVKLPENVKAQFPNLYPSAELYDHEWEKHGTCSGLTPEQYLALSKRLKNSVAVPAPYQAPEKPVRVTSLQLKKEFVASNPSLSESSLAAYCSGSGRFLQELFVCFSTDGKPTSCSKEIHDKAAKSCGNPDFLVRNVR